MPRPKIQIATDLALERNLREAIAHAPHCPTETLGVSVDARRVAAAGSVPSREAFLAVDRVLREHAGTREVLNLTTISESSFARDRRRARELGGRLETRFPRADVRVAVLGETAVLAGRAPTTRSRAEMATIAALEPHVERTVNQIECPR